MVPAGSAARQPFETYEHLAATYSRISNGVDRTKDGETATKGRRGHPLAKVGGAAVNKGRMATTVPRVKANNNCVDRHRRQQSTDGDHLTSAVLAEGLSIPDWMSFCEIRNEKALGRVCCL